MNQPIQTNAANKGQIKQARRKERSLRERELDDVKAVLSTKEGRRVWWKFLDFCGVFRSSFTGNNSTFYNEGQRNVGLKMLGDMNEAMPDAYALMLKEAKEVAPPKNEDKDELHETESAIEEQ